MIKINEIFYSIQGESSYAGWPTVFVRTSGCNLRCTYCDTTYAYYEGSKISVDEIIEKVGSFGTKYVCITGGEPLLQSEVIELMKKLCDRNYHVSLETSGSLSCVDVDPRVKKIIDVKTPDSGAPNTFVNENLSFATAHDEFKFVICSDSDFDWAEEFVSSTGISEKCSVLYSPSFGKINENILAKKILSQKSNARLQLQLHKYIWSHNTRGV